MRHAGFVTHIVVFSVAVLWSALAQDSGPSVTVDKQSVVEGRLVIARVVSSGAGWLVVHSQVDGKPGLVIGHAAVHDGVNLDVIVTVDPRSATDTLYAMLHSDGGAPGVYEFPGPDAPVVAGGMTVNVPFAVARTVRVDMKASRYEFSPATVRVKAGTPVELHVVSSDGTHGIAIPGLKISERLPRGREIVISFTPAAGRYPFRCSVFCGSGHGDMHGEVIAE